MTPMNLPRRRVAPARPFATPVNAGVHARTAWIPAFAGMTMLFALGASSAHAQADSARRDSAGRAGPPVRRIATASSLSTEPIGSINQVRELPGGRLLLNDGQRRRLLLMDTTLRLLGVVLDSLAEVENAYGTRPGAIVPYRGDSTLFLDPASFVMLVLDPAGKPARVRSVPRVQDVDRIMSGASNGGVDAKGRLVYRMQARPAPPTVAPPRGVPWIPSDPDSAFVVAMDLDTRKQDTLGSYRIPKNPLVVRRTANGIDVNSVHNPLPSTDEWAVLPDGAVAFVRGVDYRVDYLGPDGRWTSSPKLPYEWQRLTDDDRQRMVDSVKATQRRSAMQSYVTAMIRWVNGYGKSYPAGFTVPEGYNLPQGLARDWRLPPGVTFPQRYVHACAPGEEPTMTPPPGAAAGAAPNTPAGAPAAGPPNASPAGPPGPIGGGGTPSCIPAPIMGGGNVPPPPTLRENPVIDPTDLPGYRPPFTQGAVRADLDGNLWVRTVPVKPVPGGPVFDVVSRAGELVDRIQIPSGYTVVGFGRGRVVYLSMRDQRGIHLARVRLR